MTPYERGYYRTMKLAGLGSKFIDWAQNTSPIMGPLARAQKTVLHGLGDAGHGDMAVALNKVIGGESPVGRLMSADRAVSRRLGLLAPEVVKETETRLKMTPELMAELGL